jgi:hypothetical protein
VPPARVSCAAKWGTSRLIARALLLRAPPRRSRGRPQPAPRLPPLGPPAAAAVAAPQLLQRPPMRVAAAVVAAVAVPQLLREVGRATTVASSGT